jgi:hypothetical protein
MPSQIVLNGTTGIANASWTTATRPSAPVAGQQGYNTDIGALETYTGATWSTSDLPAPSTAGNVLTSTGSAWTSSTPNAGFSGATTVSSGTSITLTNTSTQVQLITMTTTGLSVTLPDATTLTAGGVVFCLVNNSQNAFDIKTNDGAIIATLEYGATISLFLTSKTAAAGTWSTVTKPFFLSVAATSYTSISPTTFTGGALLSPTLVVLSYISGGYPYVVAGTISGTTVTWGTGVQIYSADTVSQSVISRMSATTAAVALYTVSGTLPQLVGVSVSGTTVTFGAATYLVGGAPGIAWVYNVTDNLGVVAYYNGGNNNLKAFTQSGTTLTVGTAATYANNNAAAAILGLDSSRFMTNDPGGAGQVIISVSGTTITTGTASATGSGTNGNGGILFSASNVCYVGSYRISYNSTGTTINSITATTNVPGYYQGTYQLINSKYVGINSSGYLGTVTATSTANSAFSDSTLSIPSTFGGTKALWTLDSTTALTFAWSAGTSGYIGVKFIKVN